MHLWTTFITTIFLALATSAGASQISSDPSTLRQTAKTVSDAANSIQHSAQTADNAVAKLLQSFQGAAASSVQGQIAKAEAGVRQAVQAYQSIVTTLERAAQ